MQRVGWLKQVASPPQHPRSTGDVDTEREGLPDTAGILRATEEAVGLQEKKEGGV